jgi:hypothetical protein
LFVSRDLERILKEFNCAFHVGGLVQVDAHPAALGEDVVRFSATCGHQRVSDLFWKGYVDEMVSMYVTNSRLPKRNSVPPNLCDWASIPMQPRKAVSIFSLAPKTGM